MPTLEPCRHLYNRSHLRTYRPSELQAHEIRNCVRAHADWVPGEGRVAKCRTQNAAEVRGDKLNLHSKRTRCVVASLAWAMVWQSVRLRGTSVSARTPYRWRALAHAVACTTPCFLLLWASVSCASGLFFARHPPAQVVRRMRLALTLWKRAWLHQPRARPAGAAHGGHGRKRNAARCTAHV